MGMGRVGWCSNVCVRLMISAALSAGCGGSSKANEPPATAPASDSEQPLLIDITGAEVLVGGRSAGRSVQELHQAIDTQIDSLRETVLNLTHENELLKRRICGNRTERSQTSELQLALGNLRPLVDGFFDWVKQARSSTQGRNLATKALGYALNQEQELRRVLNDGRLPLDNTRSERSLRKIVVGRKTWMFYGSDTHAESAAAIFTIIASCRLHALDPEQYLDEVLRVLPHWPKQRYLELAPKFWKATREKLDPHELDAPICAFTIPPVA